MKLTPLEKTDLLHRVPLLARSLLQLGHLHLLAELLEISLSACFCGCPLACCLVDELLLDLAHVLVTLDHLCKVVCWSGEGQTLLLENCAGTGQGVQGLLVESELAVEVVVDIGNLNWCLADDDLVFRERQLGRQSDGLVGALKSGCVVDSEALMGDDVALVFGCD